MEKFSYIRYSAVYGLILGFWKVVVLMTNYLDPNLAEVVFVPYLEDIVSILIIWFSLYYFKKSWCVTKLTISRGLKVGLTVSFVGGVVLAIASYCVMSDLSYSLAMVSKEKTLLLQSGYSLEEISTSLEMIKTMYTPGVYSLLGLVSMLFLGLGVSAVSMAFLKDK